eukprot:g691.t1
MRKLVTEQCALTDKMRDDVRNTQNVKELYDIFSRDFWVVTKVRSLVNERIVLEGTRLTIQGKEYGHEFTIRTPGTPQRWKEYEEELEHAWMKCIRNTETSSEEYWKDCLAFFYFWVNAGPLTRGSAATGYCALFALFEAAGFRLKDQMPENVQLDWEAILSTSVDEFVENVKTWLYPMIVESNEKCDNVEDYIVNVETLIQALNYKREA